MGSFYTSVVVRGAREDDVVDTLSQLGRKCFVASQGDFVFIYDEQADEQRTGVLESLALTLATRLSCPALAALNHDDDVLLLWLYDETGGELRFGFGRGLSLDGGDRSATQDEFIDQLRHVFDTGSLSPEPDPTPLRLRILFKVYPFSFAFIRHEKILRAARIPVRPSMMGYNYVVQGELRDAAPELRIRRV